MMLLLAGLSIAAFADDITIHLAPNTRVTKKTVRYECDANGAKIGVPSGPFSVDYINGGENSLVVVPISGKPLIFSNVISADGARYTARVFTWWDARGEVALSSPSPSGELRSTCKVVGAK